MNKRLDGGWCSGSFLYIGWGSAGLVSQTGPYGSSPYAGAGPYGPGARALGSLGSFPYVRVAGPVCDGLPVLRDRFIPGCGGGTPW